MCAILKPEQNVRISPVGAFQCEWILNEVEPMGKICVFLKQEFHSEQNVLISEARGTFQATHVHLAQVGTSFQSECAYF